MPGCCAYPHRGPLALPRAVPRRRVQAHGAVLGLRAWAAAELQRHLPGAAEHPQAASVRLGPLLKPAASPERLYLLLSSSSQCGLALHSSGLQPPASGPRVGMQLHVCCAATLPSGPPLPSRNNKPLVPTECSWHVRASGGEVSGELERRGEGQAVFLGQN